jgi:hypothetical protein
MSEPDALSPADIRLLTDLSRGNDWMRALLCTLARRGTWLRRTYPQRAKALLDAMTPWPVFKAGQFLFDLLEWEDFMVTGPAPEPLDGALDAVALARMTRLMQLVAAQVDGAMPADIPPPDPEPISLPEAVALPALEPGFYLYQDVVLGVVVSVEAARAARP